MKINHYWCRYNEAGTICSRYWMVKEGQNFKITVTYAEGTSEEILTKITKKKPNKPWEQRYYGLV